MITTFLGYKRKDGTFSREGTGEVINYDNHYVYYKVADAPDVVGEMVGIAKMNTQRLNIYGAQHLDELIGKPVVFAIDPSTDAANPRVTDIYLLSALGGSSAAGKDK